jgi:hypothetical protein
LIINNNYFVFILLKELKELEELKDKLVEEFHKLVSGLLDTLLIKIGSFDNCIMLSHRISIEALIGVNFDKILQKLYYDIVLEFFQFH